MEKNEEKKSLENELTEKEKIELRIHPAEGYNSTAEWIDFKSREIYNWLLTGRN